MKKIMALVLVIVMCMGAMPTMAQEYSLDGRYLMKGTYVIGGGNNIITLWADITAYEVVDILEIEVVLYRETATKDIAVWSGRITDYDMDYTEFPEKTLSMSITGYYFAEITYTVQEGTRIESDFIATENVYVY